jgi:hypothetical protein
MTEVEDAWVDLETALTKLPISGQRLVEELKCSALDYAVARGRWQLAKEEERLDIDRPRSMAHNRFIDSCNALSRACGQSDLSQHWRAIWGDARTGEARRRIGDFACFIAYQQMLAAR